MTQAEINSQPPWATALEEAVGILIGVAVLTVATGGVAEFFIADATVADTTGSVVADVTGEVGGSAGQTVTEEVATDANAAAEADATTEQSAERVVKRSNASRGWWGYNEDGIAPRGSFYKMRIDGPVNKPMIWDLK